MKKKIFFAKMLLFFLFLTPSLSAQTVGSTTTETTYSYERKLTQIVHSGYYGEVIHIEYYNDSAKIFLSYAVWGTGNARLDLCEPDSVIVKSWEFLEKTGVIQFSRKQKKEESLLLKIEVAPGIIFWEQFVLNSLKEGTK
jgi:hypothetical protein